MTKKINYKKSDMWKIFTKLRKSPYLCDQWRISSGYVVLFQETFETKREEVEEVAGKTWYGMKLKEKRIIEVEKLVLVGFVEFKEEDFIKAERVKE